MVRELTWNIFRDQLILEYEIPKWDGDLGRPNAYVALSAAVLEKKVELLIKTLALNDPKTGLIGKLFAELRVCVGWNAAPLKHMRKHSMRQRSKSFKINEIEHEFCHAVGL